MCISSSTRPQQKKNPRQIKDMTIPMNKKLRPSEQEKKT
jgi:hypothetical protein